MVDSGIFCTTAEVGHKAGANANATAILDPFTNDFVTQAESKINVLSQFNWTDVYATLDADVKGILKEAASNLAAMYVISYDMTNFNSRFEAETMLDVLKDGFNQALALLKDIKKRDFMNGA